MCHWLCQWKEVALAEPVAHIYLTFRDGREFSTNVRTTWRKKKPDRVNRPGIVPQQLLVAAATTAESAIATVAAAIATVAAAIPTETAAVPR